MYKVIFIIVPSCSNNKWLDDKMLQITEAFINILNIENYPIEVVENYSDINKFLEKAELLVVSTAGNVIVERDHLWNMIKKFPKDIGLMAHLLQYKDDITPYFHEQFFIINTDAITKFHTDFKKTSDIGIELVRSKEDLHDGHAPLFINLGHKRVKRHLNFGTSIIEECLCNGYKVRNFDLNWRYPPVSNDYVQLNLPTRGYCYPCKSTDVFALSLKNLEVLSGLDPAQETFINVINKVLEFKVLNMWHYETTVPVKSHNCVIAPATGFLGELLASESNSKKLILYDKNLNNLDFKMHLYNTWNGNDYESFARSWAAERQLSIEPSLEIDKQKSKTCIKKTYEHIFKDWIQWRNNIQIEYVYGDILDDTRILDLIEENTLIHTSTILGIYPFTAVIHDKEKIESFKNNLKIKTVETRSTWIEA
jgi:hypothetical protein